MPGKTTATRRKKLSLHVNRKAAHLETADPVVRENVVHPVGEILGAPSGQRELRVRDANGNRLASLQLLAVAVDDELITALYDWQARHSYRLPTLVKS